MPRDSASCSSSASLLGSLAALGGVVRGAFGLALFYSPFGQGFGIGYTNEGACVPHGENARFHQGLHRGGQIEQAQQIGDMAA